MRSFLPRARPWQSSPRSESGTPCMDQGMGRRRILFAIFLSISISRRNDRLGRPIFDIHESYPLGPRGADQERLVRLEHEVERMQDPIELDRDAMDHAPAAEGLPVAHR